MSKRKVFSREFKLEALRALDAGQKQATELARELGIPRSRLYAWRKQLQDGNASDAFPSHGRRSGQAAELAAIQAENARLREENEILKKRPATSRRSRDEVPLHPRPPAEHRVRTMCRVLKVSRSGFYGWRNRGCSRRAAANAELLKRIEQIHCNSRENYGAIKTWLMLRNEGIVCGRHRVARLRRTHGIEAKRMRRFRAAYALRQVEVPPAPNLLGRNFAAQAANQVWVGDATFVPTQEGWLILAVLIDLYSRQIVGWSMGRTVNRYLVTDALMMAIHHRRPKAGLIHHTDQGAAYGTASYRAILREHGMVPSMSRKAHCLDNAVAESFFSNLKNELTWHRTFKDRNEARLAIFDYIELFYNRQRIHQTNGYLSPMAREQRTCSLTHCP